MRLRNYGFFILVFLLCQIPIGGITANNLSLDAEGEFTFLYPTNGAVVNGAQTLVKISNTSDFSYSNMLLFVNNRYVCNLKTLEFIVPFFDNGVQTITLKYRAYTTLNPGGIDMQVSQDVHAQHVEVDPLYEPGKFSSYRWTRYDTGANLGTYNLTLGNFLSEDTINATFSRHLNITGTFSSSVDSSEVNIRNGLVKGKFLNNSHIPFLSGSFTTKDTKVGDIMTSEYWDNYMIIRNETVWNGVPCWFSSTKDESYSSLIAKDTGLLLQYNATLGISITLIETTFASFDTTSLLNQPPDLEIYGAGNVTVSWISAVPYDMLYSILVDGEIVKSGWTNDTISFNVEHLTVGSHNVSVVLVDKFGAEYSDSLVVKVLTNTPPTNGSDKTVASEEITAGDPEFSFPLSLPFPFLQVFFAMFLVPIIRKKIVKK